MEKSDTPSSRRKFIGSAIAASAAVGVSGPNLLLGSAKGANSRFRVAVMGLGRGKGHIRALLDVPNTEIAYLCDVDKKRLASGDNTMKGKQEKAPEKVTDFRRILDDPNIDAITIATPNFWHAPATIMACRAGKHVYVEKPGSYNPYESMKMVEVARETDRKVQLGTQRRTYSGIMEGVEKIKSGAIGKLLYARCWHSSSRGSIGKGKLADPPAELDWKMWQGPVPDAPYKDNLVHYNWHWHWKYGGGEMANNGVHSLDLARWAMGVDYPGKVTFNGGRYHFDDDQETPDTGTAVFDYGDKGISWEVSSCHPRKPESPGFVKVYGTGGMIDFSSSNYTHYDLAGKEVGKNRDKPSDIPHFVNFAEAVRDGVPLAQPINDGEISAMLCHLANIAYRTGGSTRVDPNTGKLINNPEGQKLWSRESYREGFGL